MGDLKELAVGVIVAILVIMTLAYSLVAEDFLLGRLPRLLSLRALLIAGTLLAIFLGVCVAFAPR